MAKVSLSIIIRVVAGAPFVHRVLEHLVPQAAGRAIEILVPFDTMVGGMVEQAAEWPQVRFVDMGVLDAHTEHERYDRRTACGLRLAQGEIVAMLEDTVLPDPDWCSQILDAHRLPYAIIGGAVEQINSHALNWAVYLADFGRFQLPLPEGPAEFLTDVNVSYKRGALEAVEGVWSDRYNEVAVHKALGDRGMVLWQRPQIIVRQDRGDLAWAKVIRERLRWGRLYGCVRLGHMSTLDRCGYTLLSPFIPAVLLARITVGVLRRRRHRLRLLTVLPQASVLCVCWSLGELIGYVTARET